jgi:serine protease
MRKFLLSSFVLCATLLAPWAAHAPWAQQAVQPTARVIVTYKADSALGRKRALATAVAAPHAEYAAALGVRSGLALRAGAAVAERSHVVFAGGMSSARLAALLAADPEVESAVPDRRRKRMVVPSDPLYPSGLGGDGPAAGQWYLRAPLGAVRSSINVEPAWDISRGSPGVVVAVLDSGVRFDHPDLKTVAAGGNLLPGYDFISDLDVANDSSGRDGDPSDPGDWLDATDTASGKFAPDCTAADEFESSWHGTQVAALVAALTDNAVGMASVGRGVRVLPVRVLGKCGGFDSDIVAAMRWSAGLTVAGVPANPNPARIINMSLGGSGACTALYQNAINEILAAGSVVVSSAGNSDGSPVSEPANCGGVIAVAGLRHIGTKVDFSDIGPEIAISAPGGNCVNEVGACLFPILTASNTGLTTPEASTYTTSFGFPTLGTSFSAPLVAGTAALMLSAQPAMSPSDLRTVLQATARAFPSTGGSAGLPICQAPRAGLMQLECYCTTSTCGAGMLDAGAAVAVTQAGLAAGIGVSPAAPTTAQPIVLSAAPTFLLAPRTAQYSWTLVNGGGIVAALAGSGATVSATASAAGSFVVRLTVTDSTGAVSSTTQTVTVRFAAPAPIDEDSGGGGGAVGAGWLVLLLAGVLALRRAG